MEVGSPGLSAVPSWVIVDNHIHRKDLASFLNDGRTSATACASNGECIRVSLILSALPGTSRLCLHCSEDREMCSLDNVVAAHGNAVLFRLKIEYERLLSPDKAIDWEEMLLSPDKAIDWEEMLPSSDYAIDWEEMLPSPFNDIDHDRLLLPPDDSIDYFIYWAGPSGPELTLLPRWYMTQLEILAKEEDGSWNRTQRITMGIGGTGLLLTGCEGEFVVAELQLNLEKLEKEHWDAPLEGMLIKLCSDRKAVATGIDKWEVKYTTARGGKAKFGDLRGWWETHVVLPYGSYLCWVDYYKGIIFSDVNHNSPDLQYLPLPLEYVPLGCPNPLGMLLPEAYRAVCITKGGTMKFINIVRGDGMLWVSTQPDSGFTITMYTLIQLGYDEMKWQKGVTIKAEDLWAMEGYDIHLPHITPQFPLLSMDEPGIIYFVLPLVDHTKTWVVALDTDNKRILWNREIRAIPSDEDLEMSSYNICCNMPLFPCEVSKYLQKEATPSKKSAAGKKAAVKAYLKMVRHATCIASFDETLAEPSIAELKLDSPRQQPNTP